MSEKRETEQPTTGEPEQRCTHEITSRLKEPEKR